MNNNTENETGMQCPACKEIITEDYLEQHPYPELPCPCCGSLIEHPSLEQEEIPWENRRKDERFNASLSVTYKSFKRFMIEYTKNVSRGGMFIKTKSPYEPGQRIAVSFHVPGLTGPLSIDCRVAHRRSSPEDSGEEGIGVEFLDMDEKSREMLISYISQHRGE